MTSAEALAVVFAVGVLAGSLAPTYYAAERLRGAGRAFLGRLPYRPPPGTDREEAMEKAAAEQEEHRGN